MDSIDQIRQNMSEVDMLLNYASQNANDVQKYQLFNKAAVVLLSTKFEVFLEDFIDEHSRKILNVIQIHHYQQTLKILMWIQLLQRYRILVIEERKFNI